MEDLKLIFFSLNQNLNVRFKIQKGCISSPYREYTLRKLVNLIILTCMQHFPVQIFIRKDIV